LVPSGGERVLAEPESHPEDGPGDQRGTHELERLRPMARMET